MITLKFLGKHRIEQATAFANRLLEDVNRDGYAIDSLKITDHFAKRYSSLTENLEECFILASQKGDTYSITAKT